LKTYRNLYPQVYAWENLELAYRRARKGKRARAPAAAFEFDRERNLTELQQELREKTYCICLPRSGVSAYPLSIRCARLTRRQTHAGPRLQRDGALCRSALFRPGRHHEGHQ